jgi:hypothetical protein
MSDDNSTVTGYGVYHPGSAAYQPYNDAMAAWRNEVKAMQGEGTLPASDDPESVDALERPQEASEPVQERVPDPAPQGDSDGPEEELETPQATPDPEPQGDDSGEEPREVYDPSAHTAPEVLDHLRNVGVDEATLILDSEASGKNRRGITNLREELLANARKNDEKAADSSTE